MIQFILIAFFVAELALNDAHALAVADAKIAQTHGEKVSVAIKKIVSSPMVKDETKRTRKKKTQKRKKRGKRNKKRDSKRKPLSKSHGGPAAAVRPAAVAPPEAKMVSAIEKMELKEVMALKDAGVSLNVIDQSQQSGLMKLAESGDVQAVDAILKLGANLNIENNRRETALWSAVNGGHEKLALHLLDLGAKADQLHAVAGECLMHRAIKDSMRELTLKLMKVTPGCMAQKNANGETPLELAKRLRADDIVAVLSSEK